MNKQLGKLDFEEMSKIDIHTVDKKSLVDLDTVIIDESRPVQERLASFVEQIKNPYCFRIGDIAVKVKYNDDGPTFQECFEELLSTAYR